MLSIKKSLIEDIPALKDTAKKSFAQAGIDDFGDETIMPPGVSDGKIIDNLLEKYTTFTLRWEKEIVGGIGFELKESTDHFLHLLWIVPEHQKKGIGRKAMEFLENTNPDTNSWNLETPQTSERNVKFYEGLGYKEVGQQSFENSKVVLIEYRKEM